MAKHAYGGTQIGRAARLQSKVRTAEVLTIERLEELLGGKREPIPEGLRNPRPVGKTVKHTFRMETP